MSRWIARSQARQRFLMVAPALAPEGRAGGCAGGAGSTTASATSGITLFLPRIGVVAVAAGLPEAGLVGLDEPHAGDPLRALPEVEVGHEAAHRRAVLA